MIPYLRTFAIWSLLCTGLLFSGLIAVEAIREYAGHSESDIFVVLPFVFAVSGGLFFGLVAVGVRLATPSARGLRLQGQELLVYAESLGVSRAQLHDSDTRLNEPELQRRVLEAERALRERHQLLIVLAAAVTSALSALAAWTAVFFSWAR